MPLATVECRPRSKSARTPFDVPPPRAARQTNYGNVGILDTIHGTNKMYLDHLAAKSKAAKEEVAAKKAA